eukprot:CAMPEP_0174235262 /NCGR_PEP_ID=MMETSP0417-20130205/4771_1 /TAXON_ID=242541 /ORGANISM="Mayorella sp, Strain BSH-02190019" /LENGTH=86 /DNA_ID=CAMNT_0015313747 /DNA_START=36 /DNA_END=296 /DNA_ORIENTATION=+
MSSHTEENVRSKLLERVPAEHVEVVDESDGCGAKFSVLIVAKAFEGVPLLERHRMVNKALENELKEIHALSIKARTPAQQERIQSK